MPHEHVPLGLTENGELGPICHYTGKIMTFGEAMVIDEHYVCWEYYQKLTGAVPSNKITKSNKPFYNK
jgi:hypothetical protein